MQFEEAYRKYHRDIFAVAVHCLMDGDAAEDVVQDTFIRYKKSLDQGKIKGDPKNWLYRVALNCCFDYRRYVKKFSRDLVNTLIGKNSVVQFELSEEVEVILKELSEKERAVVTLKYMEEMSYEEISRVMKTPVGTLKSLSSRALKKLKEKRHIYE